MKQLLLFFIFFLTVLSKDAIGQSLDNMFKGELLKGNIGNSKITIQLFIDDTIVEGYYFYDRIGNPMQISGKRDGLVIELDVVEKHPASILKLHEFFRGKIVLDSSNNILEFKGTWNKDNDFLDFYAKRIPTNINWHKFSYKLYYYNTESEYDIKKQLEEISFVYPSLKTAPILNYSILPTLLGKHNSRFIDYINMQNSNTLNINSSYYDNSFYKVCECCDCESSFENSTISYFNDSIVSYTIYNSRFVIGVHGWEDEYYLNYDISTGKLILLNDILSKENEDIVTRKIIKKYEIKSNNENSATFRISGFQIFSGGINFNNHDCNMCSFDKFFMSYLELKPFINDKYKYLINQ